MGKWKFSEIIVILEINFIGYDLLENFLEIFITCLRFNMDRRGGGVIVY